VIADTPRIARQQPHYDDPELLATVVTDLELRDGLVLEADVDRLLAKLAKVANGQAFVLQAGNCAEMFNTSRSKLSNMVRVILQMALIVMYGAQVEIVKILRGAGQYAKPRSAELEVVDGVSLPTYRGDLVHGHEPTVQARRHDPRRLATAYDQSQLTLGALQELSTGAMADLGQIHDWNLDFVREAPRGPLTGRLVGGVVRRRYRLLVSNIRHVIGFMKACGVDVDAMRELKVAEVFVSHEGLVLDYERALVRDGYATSGHFLWIGERTRELMGAHVEFFRSLRNPIGVKLGPTTTTSEVLQYCRVLNPDNIPGRLVFISRMGAGNVARVLPELMRAVKEAGYSVVWVCDPMHGNTFTTAGVKTRRMRDIKAEIRGFFAACAAVSVWPGGIQAEITGEPNVTEVLGGLHEITKGDLGREYTSACDPRLNARQALEIAFFVSRLLRGCRAKNSAM
jgi:3-deoxy-7-phosphoheptulonate synthase